MVVLLMVRNIPVGLILFTELGVISLHIST